MPGSTADVKAEIVILGAGNVGAHIARRLHTRGYRIRQIGVRDKKKAVALARDLKSEIITSIKNIYNNADFYLFAIPDQSLSSLVRKMPEVKGIAAHFSGTLPSAILKGIGNGHGVIYPVQTFRQPLPPDFKTVPWCITASSPAVKKKLKDLVSNFSGPVFYLDDEQRKYLHLAAVFANNFTNHLASITSDILKA